LTTDSTIAVLGLGAMGLPMATRLAQRFTVRGYDVDRQRRDLAEKAGCSTGDSARAVAEKADVVLLAVRDEAQLEDVLLDPDHGVLPVLADGALVILTSTVGIAAAKQLAAQLEPHGVQLVDAPVSGGPARAGAGDLLIVVGAGDEAYAATEPVLNQLASTVERMGAGPGDGQAMKTVNQLLCGVHIAAAAEALALAQALGLDQAQALRTLQAGAAASFMLGDRGPRMLAAYSEDDVEVRSRLDIFVKDLGIVSRAAQGAGRATPVSSAAEHLFRIGQAHGLAANDDSAVITVLNPAGANPSSPN
jgi:3-hydroxyisobutyrate dehydrogenase